MVTGQPDQTDQPQPDEPPQPDERMSPAAELVVDVLNMVEGRMLAHRRTGTPLAMAIADELEVVLREIAQRALSVGAAPGDDGATGSTEGNPDDG